MSDINNFLEEKEVLLKDINNLKFLIEDIDNDNIKFLIEEKEVLLKNIDLKIARSCKHEIINDYIDTMFPYREGILISYCKFCELSKSFIEINRY